MKTTYKILFFVALMTIQNQLVNSQTIDSSYQVATWSGYRNCAISYTFDDNCPNQFKVAIPVFNEYGLNLTLFTIVNFAQFPADWTKIQAAESNGHEVASHTMTHPHLGAIDTASQRIELKNSQSIINSHVSGQKCLTMAYPYCELGNNNICKQYYFCARGCQGFTEPKTPGNIMNVSSTICGSAGSVNSLKNFKDRAIAANKSQGWLVYLIHGIDNDGGYSPLNSTVFLQGIQYIYANSKDKYWISTFGNVSRYLLERNAASITETGNTDTTITFQLTDALADSIFNYPLTIRRLLPESWPSADVSQNGIQGTTQIIEIDTSRYVIFDAIPDDGDVILSKNLTVVTPGLDTIVTPVTDTIVAKLHTNLKQSVSGEAGINVWLAKNNLMVCMPKNSGMNLVITIYDMNGRTIASYKVKKDNDGMVQLGLTPSLYRSGVYMVNINDGTNSWSKQVIII